MSSLSIDPRKARGVTNVLNVTFRLLRARWALFGKAILYFGAPLFILGMALLVGGILAAVVFGASGGAPGATGAAGLGVLIGVGLLLAGGALAIAGIVSIVRLHVDTETDEVTLEAVWQQTKASAWGVLGIQVMHGLSFLLLAPIGGIPCIGTLIVLGGMVYLTVRYFYLAVPVRVLYDTSAFSAISRAKQLVDGAFWQTAGVFLLVYVAQMILNASITLPVQLLMFSGSMHGLDADTLPAWMGAVAVGVFLLVIAISVLGYGIMYGAAAVQVYALTDQQSATSVEDDVAQLEREVDDERSGWTGGEDQETDPESSDS